MLLSCRKIPSLEFATRACSSGRQWKHAKSSPSMLAKMLPKKTWRDKVADKSKPAVAVLNLHGMIMPNMGRSSHPMGGRKPLNIETTQKVIDKAFAVPKLEAVLLNINSPGGYPVQCELIGDYITSLANEKQVPVISFVEDFACSGGYWLACASDKIYVSKTSIVGSIGVISASFGLNNAISKLGIERRVTTAGTSKSFNDPFLPQTDKDKARLTRMLTHIHDNFKDHVIGSRGGKLKGSHDDIFNGDVWVGQQAIDIGLADGLSSVNGYIKSEFGGDKTVRVERVKGSTNPFQEWFGASAMSSPLMMDPNTYMLQQLAMSSASSMIHESSK